MQNSARLVLEPDDRIKLMPHGQSLIEFIVRSTQEVLNESSSTEDFRIRMNNSIVPFYSDLGPLQIDLLDHEGNPADVENDECVIVLVSMNSSIH